MGFNSGFKGLTILGISSNSSGNLENEVQKKIKSYVIKKGEYYSLSAFERKRTSFAWIVADPLWILLMSAVVQFYARILCR